MLNLHLTWGNRFSFKFENINVEFDNDSSFAPISEILFIPEKLNQEHLFTKKF